jgi:DNA-binding PadR family transcriptional regulator
MADEIPAPPPRSPGGDMSHDMLREFFLGFIKIHILHHAGEEPVYGLALIAELRRHGYELSPGTLYPVLHQLEKAEYLRRLNRLVNGKVRKYYVLTRRGGQALDDARAKIGELMGEVLETRGVRKAVKARKPARSQRPEEGGRTS